MVYFDVSPYRDIYIIILYIYPDIEKLLSNHRFYKLDMNPVIFHSNTNYKTTTLTWSQDKTLATHSYSSFAFPEIYSL